MMKSLVERVGQLGRGAGLAITLIAASASAQFMPAVPVIELNTPSRECCAALSPDQLTVYFSSDRIVPDRWDIWRATRTNPSDPFGTPQLVTELMNETNYVGDLSPDQLRLYFTTRAGGSTERLYLAERPDVISPFNAPVPIPGLDTPENKQWMTLDGLERNVYFSNSSYEMYTSSRPDILSPFGVPTMIPELMSSTNENFPVISDDNLEIFFGSDRFTGLSDAYDIYRATRPDIVSVWSTPQRVDEISTPDAADVPSYLSPNGQILYFWRSGPTNGNGDIFVAQRCPATPPGERSSAASGLPILLLKAGSDIKASVEASIDNCIAYSL